MMILGEVGACLIESALFVYFLNKFNGCRFEHSKALCFSVVTFLILLGNILISDMVTFFSGFPIIVDFIITIIYSQLCLKGSLIEHIGGIVLYQLGMMASSVVVIFGASFNMYGIVTWMDTGDDQRIILLIICKLILILYVVAILKLRKCFSFAYNSITYLTFIFMPSVIFVLVFFLLELLFEFYSRNREGEILLTVLVITLGVMGVNIYLYFIAISKEKIEKEKEYAIELLKTQQSAYEESMSHQKEMRKIEHDMKNRLLGIYHYLISEDVLTGTQKVEELIEQYSGKKDYFLEGSYIWEMVINSKFALAESMGIETKRTIRPGDYNWVEGIDFCIILGNLLDNAIEAEEKLEDKKIEVLMQSEKGYIYLNIRNNISADRGNIDITRSSKKYEKNHGIGIKSVQELVKKYSGTMEVSILGDKFEVKILIPKMT